MYVGVGGSCRYLATRIDSIVLATWQKLTWSGPGCCSSVCEGVPRKMNKRRGKQSQSRVVEWQSGGEERVRGAWLLSLMCCGPGQELCSEQNSFYLLALIPKYPIIGALALRNMDAFHKERIPSGGEGKEGSDRGRERKSPVLSLLPPLPPQPLTFNRIECVVC